MPDFLNRFRLAFVCLLIAGVGSRTASADQPDLLMIAVDDLRPMLGCYGDERIHTPNIDQLAARSVVFDRAYCQYAKCGTSRLSLMTGLRPDSLQVFGNHPREVATFRENHPEIKSLARCIKDAGYQTRSFGKIYHDGWDLPTDWSVPSSPGREREMWEIVEPGRAQQPTVIADRWSCPVMQDPDVADEHLFAGRMTAEVIDAMRSRDPSQPHFWAVGYRRPHLPFVAPRRYFDLYHPDPTWLADNPLPGGQTPVMSWFNSDGYVGAARRFGKSMPRRPDRDQAIDWNGFELRSYLGVPTQGPLSVPKQLMLLRAYAACISYVDAQIGRLLDELTRSGRQSNTVVVLVSDHGWHLGEQSVWGKMTNFEVATRVPMIIAAPGLTAGRTEEPSELVDLYPTLCDLLEIEQPSHLEGNSLTRVLRHPDEDTGQVALSQYARFDEDFMGRAMRTRRYRLVVWTEQPTGRVVHRELYDHESDPDEMNNLAVDPTYREIADQLQSQLEKAYRTTSP